MLFQIMALHIITEIKYLVISWLGAGQTLWLLLLSRQFECLPERDQLCWTLLVTISHVNSLEMK